MASSSSSSVQPPSSGKLASGNQVGSKANSSRGVLSPASPLQRLQTYLAGVKTEWTKITWPTPMQLWGQVIIVVVMVTFMTLILWVIDNLFRFGVHVITHHP